MRKVVTSIIVTMCMLFSVACSADVNEQSGTETKAQNEGDAKAQNEADGSDIMCKAYDDWGISLVVSDVSKTGLTWTFYKSDVGLEDADFITGSRFVIEEYKDNTWVECDYVTGEPPIFTSVGYPVDGKLDETIDWKNIYGELEPGLYRLKKDVRYIVSDEEDPERVYYAEFEIK